jgi:hypothetical protein
MNWRIGWVQICNDKRWRQLYNDELHSLYGCETSSLTLREEHRLTVYENRVLSRIFGPQMDEIIGGWRKLHNEELHNLYSSPNIIIIIKSKRMRWAGHVARKGEEKCIEFWWETRRKETTRET